MQNYLTVPSTSLPAVCLTFVVSLVSAFPPESSRAQDAFAYQWAWSDKELKSAGFWPQFRGPAGDGIATAAANLPNTWSDTENIRWKIPIPGRAWSSPVAWGNTLWLTTASEDGLSMSAMSIDRKTGAIKWNKEIFQNDAVQPDFHKFNSYGSPTPVLDGDKLYVSFGAYGTAALNRDNGEIVWQRRDLPCNHFRGPGSSPILYRHMLIFHMDGFDFQYVIALDRQTGTTLWKTDRTIEYGSNDGDLKKAYSTPTLLEMKNEPSKTKQMQMISVSAKATIAYDPNDGHELWRVRYDEFSTTARPVFDGTHAFISTGYGKAKMLAVKVDGHGDVSQSHVTWESSRAIGAKPSPTIVQGTLIVVDDRGVLSAMSAIDGKPLWQHRLGGDFSGSPIVADGKIYCFDEQGKGHVIGLDGTELGTNTLDAGCMASPIAIGQDLIVRTTNSLVCIGQ
jgi:outer membrane protein assembly factor BamB